MNKIDEILNDKKNPCYIRDNYKTEGERLYFLKEFNKMSEEEKVNIINTKFAISDLELLAEANNYIFYFDSKISGLVTGVEIEDEPEEEIER